MSSSIEFYFNLISHFIDIVNITDVMADNDGDLIDLKVSLQSIVTIIIHVVV